MKSNNPCRTTMSSSSRTMMLRSICLFHVALTCTGYQSSVSTSRPGWSSLSSSKMMMMSPSMIEHCRRRRLPRTHLLLSKSSDDNNNNNNNKEDYEDSDLFSSLSSSSRSSSSPFPDTPDELLDEVQSNKQRMDIVRKLQKTFYKTASSSRIDAVVNAMKEECSKADYNDSNDNNEDIPEECKLIDTDSVEAIVTEHDIDETIDESYRTYTKCHYDESTGKLLNVPLWRTNWMEIPYRSNLVTVNEAMYTNMFEEMIRSHPKPWYVGHLYLPGGSESLRKVHLHSQDSYQYELHAWHDVTNAHEHRNPRGDLYDPHFPNHHPSMEQQQDYDDDFRPQQAAVLGTLLRVTDYRRLDDGKLLLFVQAMYRFVVDDVVQTFPYGIANIQVVPDYEELLNVEEINDDDFELPFQDSEMVCKQLRIQAVKGSIHCWQQYEFEDTLLPMKLGTNGNDGEVSNSEMEEVMTNVDESTINKLLPFSNFNNGNHDPMERTLVNALLEETKTKIEFVNLAISTTNMELQSRASSNHHFMLPSMELQLLKMGILKEPRLLQRDILMERMSLKQLEIRFWYALNDYAKTSSKPIPLSILELLPYDVQWHRDFVIKNIVSTMEKIQSLQQPKSPSKPRMPSRPLSSPSSNNYYYDAEDSRYRQSHPRSMHDDHYSPPRVIRSRRNTNHLLRTKMSLSSSSSSDSMNNYRSSRHQSDDDIQYKPCYHRVSEQYPNIRRVQRLSYHAGELLEEFFDTQPLSHHSHDDETDLMRNRERQHPRDTNYKKIQRQQRLMNVTALRERLLEIPSIHGRLAFITQQLEFRNMNQLHAFE